MNYEKVVGGFIIFLVGLLLQVPDFGIIFGIIDALGILAGLVVMVIGLLEKAEQEGKKRR